MTTPDGSVADRVSALEGSVRRLRLVASALGLLVAGFVFSGFQSRLGQTVAEIRTRRLVMVDDAGVIRAVIGQDRPDPSHTDRISRAAGLTLFDATGHERGGFTSMEDGSVGFGLDAPSGVGAPMRDRLALKVMPDGSAYVMLIDNSTRAVAKLQSDGMGGGGVQVFKWDTTANRVHIRTLQFAGDLRDSVSLRE